ncbi:MAG: hypothetical protein Q7R73_00745 [bacterium]|nr:hypothetical protein [bacterium]
MLFFPRGYDTIFLGLSMVKKERVSMERKGIAVLSPKEFMARVTDTAQEFVVKNYPDKKLVYFEILLNKNEKLVCKMSPDTYARLGKGLEAETQALELFQSAAITGSITIREIMRDARPNSHNAILQDYFFQHSNSRYAVDDPLYPVGLAFGYLYLVRRNPDDIFVILRDRGDILSGAYQIARHREQLLICRC